MIQFSVSMSPMQREKLCSFLHWALGKLNTGIVKPMRWYLYKLVTRKSLVEKVKLHVFSFEVLGSIEKMCFIFQKTKRKSLMLFWWGSTLIALLLTPTAIFARICRRLARHQTPDTKCQRGHCKMMVAKHDFYNNFTDPWQTKRTQWAFILHDKVTDATRSGESRVAEVKVRIPFKADCTIRVLRSGIIHGWHCLPHGGAVCRWRQGKFEKIYIVCSVQLRNCGR